MLLFYDVEEILLPVLYKPHPLQGIDDDRSFRLFPFKGAQTLFWPDLVFGPEMFDIPRLRSRYGTFTIGAFAMEQFQDRRLYLLLLIRLIGFEGFGWFAGVIGNNDIRLLYIPSFFIKKRRNFYLF